MIINVCLLVAFVLLLTIIDIRRHIIPDVLLLGFVFMWVSLFLFQNWPVRVNVAFYFLSGSGLSFVLFYGVYRCFAGKMGFGDVKFAAVIGLVTGPLYCFLAFFAASLCGLLVVIPLLLAGKINVRSRIPFGPFLGAGLLIAYVLLNLRVIEFLQVFLYD